MEIRMTITLESKLNKYKNIRDFEFNGIKFRTNIPYVGPYAYLNIIFPPATMEIQRQKILPLNLPSEIALFYQNYNGASILNGSIDIYGFLPDSYSLNRRNWKDILPYDIMEDNITEDGNFPNNKLIFGSYGYDRSDLIIDINDGTVICENVEKDETFSIRWPSLTNWYESEIDRLNEIFDENGKLLTDIKNTLPF